MIKKYSQGKHESQNAYLTRLYKKGYTTSSSMRKVAGIRFTKVTAWFAKKGKGKPVAAIYSAERSTLQKMLSISRKQADALLHKPGTKWYAKQAPKRARAAKKAKAKKDAFEAKIGKLGTHVVSEKRYSWLVGFNRHYYGKPEAEPEETARYASNQRLSNSEVEARVVRMFRDSPYYIEKGSVHVIDMSIDRGFNSSLEDY